jgi:AcrR family transcriptional regulator
MSPKRSPAPPRPRRDAAATRDAILQAARRQFSARGYEHAGVREIAADAGVTAALVNRYFGSKEQLFCEALEHAFTLPSLIPEDPEKVGEALAAYATAPEGSRPRRDFDPLQLILRSVTSPDAAEILRRQIDENSIGPMAQALGGEDAELRAAMVWACMAGMKLVRKVVRSEAVRPGTEKRLAELFAPVIQACVEAGRPSGE